MSVLPPPDPRGYRVVTTYEPPPPHQKVIYVKQAAMATPATTASGAPTASLVTPPSMKSHIVTPGRSHTRPCTRTLSPVSSALATPFRTTLGDPAGVVDAGKFPVAASHIQAETGGPDGPSVDVPTSRLTGSWGGGLSQSTTASPTALRSMLKEFENLLNMERAQKALALEARDKEIDSLKYQLLHHEQTLRAHPGQPQQQLDFTALLQTKEGELRSLLQLKTKEIEVLQQRLQAEEKLRHELTASCALSPTRAPAAATEQETARLRRQITNLEGRLKQAEVVADTRQQQYQSLLKELAVKESLVSRVRQLHPEDVALQTADNKTAMQLDYLETEVTSMRKLIDDLVFEKQELQQLLIQKDKQLAVMTGVDPNEASAVQLSMQAISMVQDATQLKEQIRALEVELVATNRKAQDFKERFEETYNKLAEKRQEAAVLVEALGARDLRIAKLDSLAQLREKELMQLRDDMRISICKEREQAARLQTELKILEDTHVKLREELSIRDDNALNLKSEIVRQSRYNQSAEERINVLGRELEEAQKHLQRLIKQNVAKDKYMLELERRMKENDVKRQATYLTELAKHRRLQLNLRLKEDDCRLALHDKDDQIVNLQTDLKASTKQVAAVKQLLLHSSSDSPTSTAVNKKKGDVHPNGRRGTPLGPKPAKRSPSSESPLRPQTDHPPPVLHSSPVVPDDPKRLDPVGTGIFATDSGVSSSSETDAIDAALKVMLRKPEWRTLKPLFFRLSSGVYLFGAQRVGLRWTPEGKLLGQPNVTVNEWYPFDAFVGQLVVAGTANT